MILTGNNVDEMINSIDDLGEAGSFWMMMINMFEIDGNSMEVRRIHGVWKRIAPALCTLASMAKEIDSTMTSLS